MTVAELRKYLGHEKSQGRLVSAVVLSPIDYEEILTDMAVGFDMRSTPILFGVAIYTSQEVFHPELHTR